MVEGTGPEIREEQFREELIETLRSIVSASQEVAECLRTIRNEIAELTRQIRLRD